MGFTTAELKKKYMALIAEDDIIAELLSIPGPPGSSDNLVNIHIFPYGKIDFTVDNVGTYLGLKINYPSICDNKLYKNYELILLVVSHYDHLETEQGDSRIDLVGERLVELFNGRSDMGFELSLSSDLENPLPFKENFYYRKLTFRSIIANNTLSSVKCNV